MLLGLRTAISAAPDLAGAKAWWTELPGKEPYLVGEGIQVGSVKDLFGSVVGFIENPHVGA